MAFWLYRKGRAILAEQQKRILSGVFTVATVTGYLEKPSANSEYDSILYFPKLIFVTNEGRQISTVADYGANWQSYKIGEQTKISYNPQNPQQVDLLNHTPSKVLLPAVMGIGLYTAISCGIAAIFEIIIEIIAAFVIIRELLKSFIGG